MSAGEIVLIPAEIPHLAGNDNANTLARALVTHSPADKDNPFLIILKSPT